MGMCNSTRGCARDTCFDVGPTAEFQPPRGITLKKAERFATLACPEHCNLLSEEFNTAWRAVCAIEHPFGLIVDFRAVKDLKCDLDKLVRQDGRRLARLGYVQRAAIIVSHETYSPFVVFLLDKLIRAASPVTTCVFTDVDLARSWALSWRPAAAARDEHNSSSAAESI
jgi:hypothetical protein